MLSRLHAREQLAAIDAAGLASGGFEQFTHMRMMERLRRAARGEKDQARAPRIGNEQLGMMGIGVTIVPAAGPVSGDEGAGR